MTDVEHEEGRRRLGKPLHRQAAAGDGTHLEALVDERAREDRPQPGVVLTDADARRSQGHHDGGMRRACHPSVQVTFMRPSPRWGAMTSHLTQWIADSGLVAVCVLMGVDAVLPAGGELVMLFGGALAAGAIAGHAGPSLAAVIVAGALGYLAGSLAGWAIGRA